ncbi:MAG: PQQ-dependent sugar dehydrogenase [Halioglobus sp.]
MNKFCIGLLSLATVASFSIAGVRAEDEKLVIDEDEVIASEAAYFRIETVAEGLETPWSMEFLPDGDALIGDRESGKLERLNIITGELTPVVGLPALFIDPTIGSGLFDVLIHPKFQENNWVYIVAAGGSQEASGLVVTRMELKGNKLSNGKTLLETSPRISGKWHYGGRLAFSEGKLFISTGDGNTHSHLAQDLSAHVGKILRIGDDGTIPQDNPFVANPDALPEIWSYGVRNPQGMTTHPDTGAIWTNEHGPQGGDEVNIPRSGVNYGWPAITYGEEYGGGPIGDGETHREGMQQPVYYWRPSIAPSGIEFYRGDEFPGWNSSLFNGALALKHLNRLVIEEDRVIHEERLLEDKGWRIRFVETGPDGYLYFGIDEGLILRLVPAPEPAPDQDAGASE